MTPEEVTRCWFLSAVARNPIDCRGVAKIFQLRQERFATNCSIPRDAICRSIFIRGQQICPFGLVAVAAAKEAEM